MTVDRVQGVWSAQTSWEEGPVGGRGAGPQEPQRLRRAGRLCSGRDQSRPSDAETRTHERGAEVCERTRPRQPVRPASPAEAAWARAHLPRPPADIPNPVRSADAGARPGAEAHSQLASQAAACRLLAGGRAVAGSRGRRPWAEAAAQGPLHASPSMRTGPSQWPASKSGSLGETRRGSPGPHAVSPLLQGEDRQAEARVPTEGALCVPEA